MKCYCLSSLFVAAGYAPIRFTGNSGVKLNLGYAFFIDLQERQRPETEDVSTGVNGRRRKRRNADNSGDIEQVVELEFRAVNLEDSVLLNSKTDSSNHIIEVIGERVGLVPYYFFPWNSLFDMPFNCFMIDTFHHLKLD